MSGLTADEAWSLEPEAGMLVLHAGADLRYAIADVAPPVADEVLAAWRRGTLDRAALSARAGEVVDQLAVAGALRGTVPPGGAVSVLFAGDQVPGLASIAGGGPAVPVEVRVLVRTTGTLAELSALAATVPDPYLVVDAAYHHTLSLGPFVVPGETACAGCLAGRLAARWGDTPPPARPAAAHAAVAAAIVAHEVGRLARQEGGRLVNRTVALDLDRWTAVEQTVLRLPWCPVCGSAPAAAGSDGRFELPWAEP